MIRILLKNQIEEKTEVISGFWKISEIFVEHGGDNFIYY